MNNVYLLRLEGGGEEREWVGAGLLEEGIDRRPVDGGAQDRGERAGGAVDAGERDDLEQVFHAVVTAAVSAFEGNVDEGGVKEKTENHAMEGGSDHEGGVLDIREPLGDGGVTVEGVREELAAWEITCGDGGDWQQVFTL